LGSGYITSHLAFEVRIHGLVDNHDIGSLLEDSSFLNISSLLWFLHVASMVVVRMPMHVVDFTILGYGEGDGGRSRAGIAPKERDKPRFLGE
jgi:hypothetical protein